MEVTGIRIGIDTSQAAQGEKEFNRSLDSMASKSRTVTEQIKNYFGGLKGAIGSLRESMFGLRELFELTIAGFGFEALSEGIEKIQDLHFGLMGVTGSAEAANAQWQYLMESGNRLDFEVVKIADSFIDLEAATKGTELQGERTRIIFEGVMTAADGMGRSTEQAGSMLHSFTSLLSRASVDGQFMENVLARQIPGALAIAARAFGVTTEQMKRMLETQSVGSKDFAVRFAVELQKEFEAAAEAATGTISFVKKRLTNAWTDMLKDIGEGGVGHAIVDLMSELVSVLNSPDFRRAVFSLGEMLVGVLHSIAGAVEFAGSHIGLLKVGFEALIAVRLLTWISGVVEALTILKEALFGVAEAEAAVAAGGLLSGGSGGGGLIAKGVKVAATAVAGTALLASAGPAAAAQEGVHAFMGPAPVAQTLARAADGELASRAIETTLARAWVGGPMPASFRRANELLTGAGMTASAATTLPVNSIMHTGAGLGADADYTDRIGMIRFGKGLLAREETMPGAVEQNASTLIHEIGHALDRTGNPILRQRALNEHEAAAKRAAEAFELGDNWSFGSVANRVQDAGWVAEDVATLGAPSAYSLTDKKEWVAEALRAHVAGSLPEQQALHQNPNTLAYIKSLLAGAGGGANDIGIAAFNPGTFSAGIARVQQAHPGKAFTPEAQQQIYQFLEQQGATEMTRVGGGLEHEVFNIGGNRVAKIGPGQLWPSSGLPEVLGNTASVAAPGLHAAVQPLATTAGIGERELAEMDRRMTELGYTWDRKVSNLGRVAGQLKIIDEGNLQEVGSANPLALLERSIADQSGIHAFKASGRLGTGNSLAELQAWAKKFTTGPDSNFSAGGWLSQEGMMFEDGGRGHKVDKAENALYKLLEKKGKPAQSQEVSQFVNAVGGLKKFFAKTESEDDPGFSTFGGLGSVVMDTPDRIMSTGIHPALRNRGLGQLMYLQTMLQAKKAGANDLSSDDYTSPMAQRVWKSLGKQLPVEEGEGIGPGEKNYSIDLSKVKASQLEKMMAERKAKFIASLEDPGIHAFKDLSGGISPLNGLPAIAPGIEKLMTEGHGGLAYSARSAQIAGAAKKASEAASSLPLFDSQAALGELNAITIAAEASGKKLPVGLFSSFFRSVKEGATGIITGLKELPDKFIESLESMTNKGISAITTLVNFIPQKLSAAKTAMQAFFADGFSGAVKKADIGLGNLAGLNKGVGSATAGTVEAEIGSVAAGTAAAEGSMGELAAGASSLAVPLAAAAAVIALIGGGLYLARDNQVEINHEAFTMADIYEGVWLRIKKAASATWSFISSGAHALWDDFTSNGKKAMDLVFGSGVAEKWISSTWEKFKGLFHDIAKEGKEANDAAAKGSAEDQFLTGKYGNQPLYVPFATLPEADLDGELRKMGFAKDKVKDLAEQIANLRGVAGKTPVQLFRDVHLQTSDIERLQKQAATLNTAMTVQAFPPGANGNKPLPGPDRHELEKTLNEIRLRAKSAAEQAQAALIGPEAVEQLKQQEDAQKAILNLVDRWGIGVKTQDEIRAAFKSIADSTTAAKSNAFVQSYQESLAAQPSLDQAPAFPTLGARINGVPATLTSSRIQVDGFNNAREAIDRGTAAYEKYLYMVEQVNSLRVSHRITDDNVVRTLSKEAEARYSAAAALKFYADAQKQVESNDRLTANVRATTLSLSGTVAEQRELAASQQGQDFLFQSTGARNLEQLPGMGFTQSQVADISAQTNAVTRSTEAQMRANDVQTTANDLIRQYDPQHTFAQTLERINEVVQDGGQDWTAYRMAVLDAREQYSKAMDDMLMKTRTFQGGAKAALDEWSRNAMDAAQNAKHTVDDFFDSLTTNITESGTGGKTDFKGMFKQLNKDLFESQVKQNITGPLAKGLGEALHIPGLGEDKQAPKGTRHDPLYVSWSNDQGFGGILGDSNTAAGTTGIGSIFQKIGGWVGGLFGHKQTSPGMEYSAGGAPTAEEGVVGALTSSGPTGGKGLVDSLVGSLVNGGSYGKPDGSAANPFHVVSGVGTAGSLASNGTLSGIAGLVKPGISGTSSGVGGLLGDFIGSFGKLFGGGRASGGPVKANTVYEVGENGPELFSSSTAGTIMPHGSYAFASGGVMGPNGPSLGGTTVSVSTLQSGGQTINQGFDQQHNPTYSTFENLVATKAGGFAVPSGVFPTRPKQPGGGWWSLVGAPLAIMYGEAFAAQFLKKYGGKLFGGYSGAQKAAGFGDLADGPGAGAGGSPTWGQFAAFDNTALPPTPSFANGGIMTSLGEMPLRRYASGGIADTAQAAVFGEGSMPEAYVPLPDGRNIPVKMGGNAGRVVHNHQYTTNLNVHGVKDIDGFRKSQSQIASEYNQALQRHKPGGAR
jgi:tape measure domain-containing protein